MARLTVRALEALRPRVAGYKVTVDKDLYLRIAPDGTKTWLVRYVVAGKQIQARLPQPYGSSGDEGRMSLAQALAENTRIQSLARDGVDFQVQRAEAQRAVNLAKALEQTSTTPLHDLFEAWLSQGVSRKDGNQALRRNFENHVLPSIGKKPVRELTDADLLTVLRHVGRVRGFAGTATHLLTESRQMFGWAIKRQPWRRLLIDGNPADLVEQKQVVPHGYQPLICDRTLCAAEIRELRDIFERTTAEYEAAADRRIATRPVLRETQIAVWTCLGTACRIGELLQTRWEHVDFDKATWFVPRENTKTQVAWLVYLSDFSLRQFRQLRALTGDTEWCYPDRVKEGHVSLKGVTKQVGDRQIRFRQRKKLDRRRNDNTLVLADGANGPWTPHDLRRTASTMMQALRVSPDVIDRCQNHVLPGSRIRRHYLHHDYAEEKRDAWRLLGDRIDAILSSDNIIPLQRVA